MQRELLEQFARIGKALSSPSRLELLDLLCQSEKPVETLVAQSGLSLKNVSAQLKVLREAGLIRARRDGKYIYYSLADDGVGLFWSNLQAFSARQLSGLQRLTARLLGEPGPWAGVGRGELLVRARKGEVLVIDVRPGDEFAAGHLPHARSIPLGELRGRLRQLPKDKEIVAYCRGPHCLFAVEAVRLLRRNGFRASRLDDGIQEWKAAGLPVRAA